MNNTLLNTSVVNAQRLKKKYGELEVVKGISFSVKEGECFGFLGPNGAGKTTTIRMIQCFTLPTDGELEVFGMSVFHHPRKIKAMMGVTPQDDLLDKDLKVKENLTVYAGYFGISKKEADRKSDDVLEFMQLRDKAREKVNNLSGGMRRRLLIARALMNNPKLLIFDEPTTGLDPQARHLIWAKIRELKDNGVTVILTTHYMEEASRLCDRLVIMDQGFFIAEGNPQDLITKFAGDEVIEIRNNSLDKKDIATHLGGCAFELEYHEGIYYIFYKKNCDVMSRLVNAGLKNFMHRPTSLEDVFLKLTGRDLRE